MSNLHIPPSEWLTELFRYEYCAECHGDAADHDPIVLMGNWFARCKPAAVCHVEDCPEHPRLEGV